MSAPVVVLVGPPGAGKSTVGSLVAGRLGVELRDTDADIEATAGKAVSDIFIEDGEDAFRELERDAVRRALAEHRGVLALGGGAVLDDGTRKALQDIGSPVVHLAVGISAALARVGLAKSRPVLAMNPRATLLKLLEDRAPLYADVATAVVATDGKQPDEVAELVLEAIGRG